MHSKQIFSFVLSYLLSWAVVHGQAITQGYPQAQTYATQPQATLTDTDIIKLQDNLVRKMASQIFDLVSTTRDKQMIIQEIGSISNSLMLSIRNSPMREDLEVMVNGLKSKIIRQLGNMPFAASKTLERIMSPEALMRLKSGERIFSNSLNQYASMQQSERDKFELEEDGILMLLWQKLNDLQSTCSSRDECAQNSVQIMRDFVRVLPANLPITEKINILSTQLPALANSQSVLGVIFAQFKTALSPTAWQNLCDEMPEIVKAIDSYNQSKQADASNIITPSKSSYPWKAKVFSRENYQLEKDQYFSGLVPEILASAGTAQTYEDSIVQVQQVLQNSMNRLPSSSYRDNLARDLRDILNQFMSLSNQNSVGVSQVVYTNMSAKFRKNWLKGVRYNPDAHQQLANMNPEQKARLKVNSQGVFNAYLGGVINIESNGGRRNDCVSRILQLTDAWKQALPANSGVRAKFDTLQKTIKSHLNKQTVFPVLAKLLKRHLSEKAIGELIKSNPDLASAFKTSSMDNWEAIANATPHGDILIPWEMGPAPSAQGDNSQKPAGATDKIKSKLTEKLMGKLGSFLS